jgi:hypothetical protein
MTEATLDRPRILAVVGKFVGSAVTQHVRNGLGKGNLAVIPGRRRRARHRCDSARIINRTSFATEAAGSTSGGKSVRSPRRLSWRYLSKGESRYSMIRRAIRS